VCVNACFGADGFIWNANIQYRKTEGTGITMRNDADPKLACKPMELACQPATSQLASAVAISE
jgi:hypothetical protein